jgi:hypothetical protein
MTVRKDPIYLAIVLGWPRSPANLACENSERALDDLVRSRDTDGNEYRCAARVGYCGKEKLPGYAMRLTRAAPAMRGNALGLVGGKSTLPCVKGSKDCSAKDAPFGAFLE